MTNTLLGIVLFNHATVLWALPWLYLQGQIQSVALSSKNVDT